MWSWSLLLSTAIYKSYQTKKEPGWPSTPSLNPMQTFIMPKTFFPRFSFPLFTSLSLAGFCWDRKSRKVCGNLFEVFYEEFQPNFLSQRGFNSTTQPTVWSFIKLWLLLLRTSGNRNVWRKQLCKWGVMYPGMKQNKSYTGGGKLEGEVASQEDPERPKRED